MSSPVPHRIRIARHNDAGELLTLQRAAFAEAQPRLSPLRDTLSDVEEAIEAAEHEVLVAVTTEEGEWGHRGRLVGAIRIEADSGGLRLGRLTVAPDLRNRGLGSALLEGVLEEAERRRASRLELVAEGASSEDLAIYRRYGFRDSGAIEVDGGRRAIVLTRLLRPSG